MNVDQLIHESEVLVRATSEVLKDEGRGPKPGTLEYLQWLRYCEIRIMVANSYIEIANVKMKRGL